MSYPVFVQGYQNKRSCNKCGGNNELLKAIIDDGIIYEVETKCKDCDFDDYWSHGFFHSRQDGLDAAKRILLNSNNSNKRTHPLTI